MSDPKLPDDPADSSETHKLHPEVLSIARLLTKAWYGVFGYSVGMVVCGRWEAGVLLPSLVLGAAISCLGYVLLEWDKS